MKVGRELPRDRFAELPRDRFAELPRDRFAELPRLAAVMGDRGYRGLARLAASLGFALDIMVPPKPGRYPLPRRSQCHEDVAQRIADDPSQVQANVDARSPCGEGPSALVAKTEHWVSVRSCLSPGRRHIQARRARRVGDR